MKMGNPSDLSVSLLSSSDNVSSDATYIVSPLSDLPITDSELWLDSMSDSKRRKTSTSCPLTSVRPNTEDAELLTPVGSGKKTKVSVNKCSVCRKEFKTTCALKTHLLIHRHDGPHICSICQRVFKHYHQLTSHMMTHHKRKTYQCTQSGCHKTYSDKNSLKHHCASRHGVHFTSPSSTSLAYNYDLPASLWEPMVNRAASDSRSLFISQPKPVSTPVLKDPSYSGTLKLGFGCYSEDTHPAQVKRSTPQESWTLATASESYKVKESTKTLNSTQWALGINSFVENPVVSQNPFDVHGLETKLDFHESYPEERKEMLSFQPNREASTSSVGFPTRPPASVGHKKHCPILLKHNLKDPKPLNKRRPSFSSSTPPVLLVPEPKSDFDCNLPDPALPSTPPHAPLPNSRKRKSCSKHTLSNVPTHPLPVPQPGCHKRSRSHSSYLVSPSQVALASFSTYLGNPFLQKESIMKSTGAEPNSGFRTYKRSVRRARSHPSCSQEALGSGGTKEKHNSQPSTSTLVLLTLIQGEEQKVNSGQRQKSKGTNLSPLIMPVSVPVTNVLDPQASTHQAEMPQTRKGASKRSRCLDPLKHLIIPSPPLPRLSSPQWARDQETQSLQRSRATGGYPSQLRSPTYLGDHPLSPRFHRPPYTPQPMLSPLRPGTGLYSKSLPQYQPWTPLPSTLDGVSFPTDSTVISIQPRINVGSRFQAEIPPVRDTLYLLYEEHPAQLVWAPWKDLSTNTETQQRVTELLDMCCSSVLPGGGTNIELALHCLHEVQGNITAALDLLLMRGDYRTPWHPLSDYHYTGSDHWTAQEMKVFKKALVDHDKDFQQIHNVLQTKSIAQCVEYYYNMKKLKKLKQRGRAAIKKDGCGEDAKEQTDENTQQKTTAAEGKVCARDVKSHRSPSVRIETNSRWQRV
ncbi:zinc finger protein 541 isoform X3 [Megalobrama amblycephala]|nr:zinc finger protein 541 isoform X3 [Megalobrama amblycephala]XP_048045585.1 zinc finger protein 541 isoform X3 [Megalobrama amblycephala]XP_048045586.1 zinc finger protein 541 isoform X3 [Megalobrama amblycephala]